MTEQQKTDGLKYSDLKLGEKALEVYRATARKDYGSIEKGYGVKARRVAEQGVDAIRKWNAENLPTFLNRKEVYKTRDGTTLTTTDLVIAQVLGGVNGFLMSDAGSGKSQLITDISNAYFNGDLRNSGSSIIQTANNDFRIATIMERRNPSNPAELELTGAHKACFIGIDELTRAHPLVANEFSDLGNGVYHRGGFNVRLGKEGYFLTIATGNDPRKKENRGTMDWDGAMLNRFPVALDLGSDRFGIGGTEDDSLKTKIKPATTSVLSCTPKDLTDKIIGAYHQIAGSSSDLGSEAEAVFYFLSQGANVCPGKKTGTSEDPQMRKKSLLPQWPKACVDCSRATDNGKNSLCSLVNTENGRTLTNARRYTSALDYLLRMKANDAGRELDYDARDLAFLSFELCGGLQEGILNSGILGAKYFSSNEKMMREVVGGLREEFDKQGDVFIAELDGVRQLGNDYSVIKQKQTGVIKPVKKLVDNVKLRAGFEVVTLDADASQIIPWNFAPKIIQQQKEESEEGAN
jgi:hypothetical protein